jgi:hypothetical protein
MSIGSRNKILLLSIAPLMVLAPQTAVFAEEQMTGKQFLAECDRLDPACRNEFVAGLQAVYAGKLACPERIDVNTPITPWLDYMRRRVAESPSLGDGDKNNLQLEAFMRLWPCPNK